MQPAEKVSITLPPDMLRLVREKVESGAYASTSEVIREAVRIWHDKRKNTPNALRRSARDFENR